MIRAMKMRLYPTAEQQERIDHTIDCCRFIYNYMLERNVKAYERRKDHLSYYDMQNLLPVMKVSLPWLAAADSQALKYACRQLNNAYQKFFGKQAGFPKFKSKKAGIQGYTNTNPISVHFEPAENGKHSGRVKIPCTGWVKTPEKRKLSGRICCITVKREHGQYFASMTYDDGVKNMQKAVDYENAIGLDYKSDGLYVDSDGNRADMPHYYRKSQDRLAKVQRKLSKKQGFRKGEKQSGNFKRQLKNVQKISRHIAGQRKDYLHKKSTAIAKQYDIVCVEDLNLKAMSNKGFGNGKATLDNGYGMFTSMLAYKLEERGKQLVKVDRFYPSSQLCSECGYQNPEVKDLQVREWTCPVCGTHHNRDHNAAKNIRTEGISMLKLKKFRMMIYL